VFRRLDEELEVGPILAELAAWPPLDLTLSEETRERLPRVLGGLGLALARTFKIIDPTLRNPQPYDWERAFRLFALLL
jgi:hypothetical protein